MNRQFPLILSLAFSLAACGSGGGSFGSAVEGFLGNVEKEATTIVSSKGTAKGTGFSATYERKMGKSTGDCAAAFKNYKVRGSGSFLREEEGPLSDTTCQQTDDKFKCSAPDEPVLEGSIESDGRFAIATVFEEQSDSEKLKLVAKLVGKIGQDGNAVGTLTGGFRYEKSGKAVCKFEAPVQMIRKREQPQGASTLGSLSIQYDLAGTRGSRSLGVVASGDDGRQISLRAENHLGDELTLQVENGKGSLAGKITDENRTQHSLHFEECLVDVEEGEGERRSVKLRCSDRDQEIEGEAKFTVWIKG